LKKAGDIPRMGKSPKNGFANINKGIGGPPSSEDPISEKRTSSKREMGVNTGME